MGVEVRTPLFSPSVALQENTKKAITHHLTETIKDRAMLLWYVAGGPTHYRNIFRQSFQGFAVDDTMADECFAFLAEAAGPEPGQQLDTLLQAGYVGFKQDKLRQLASAFSDARDVDAFLDLQPNMNHFQKQAIRQELLRIVNQRGH